MIYEVLLNAKKKKKKNYGAPQHIKKNDYDNITYECMYDVDDPDSACGGEMVECSNGNRVHISLIPLKCPIYVHYKNHVCINFLLKFNGNVWQMCIVA